VVAGLSAATQRSDHPEAPGVLERVVLRLGRAVTGSAPPGIGDGVVLVGPALDGPVDFLENGLPFTADIAHGHKTGHFLDQRDNRSLVGRLVADAVGSGGGHRVLDVFSCTGGFAAHAAAAGADDLTLVDVSERALELARHHVGAVGSTPHRPGPVNGRLRVATIAGDAFDVMSDLAQTGQRFDTVVVDPPSFANRAEQVERALAAYHRSARLAARLVAPCGLLFHASCSARITEASFLNQIQRGVADANREASVLTVTGHPVDHPIGFVHGAYLKAVALRMTS
jgi:23S rRNA (cytosine1962-C5)-methyltransferase